MSPPLRHGVTVTRLRGTKVDDGYGGTRVDWTNPDRLTIRGCAMAPLVEDELVARGRQGVVDGWTLYAPYGSDVDFEDRVETPHGTFEVNGTPGHWRSPYTGRESGMTIVLQSVEG